MCWFFGEMETILHVYKLQNWFRVKLPGSIILWWLSKNTCYAPWGNTKCHSCINFILTWTFRHNALLPFLPKLGKCGLGAFQHTITNTDVRMQGWSTKMYWPLTAEEISTSPPTAPLDMLFLGIKWILVGLYEHVCTTKQCTTMTGQLAAGKGLCFYIPHCNHS